MTRSQWLALAAVCGIGFVLRVVYPFQAVFGGSFTSYLETDSYNLMMYAKRFAAMPFLGSLSFAVQHNYLFSFVVGTLGRVLPIEIVGAWLPPVVAVGVFVVVYFIGQTLFKSHMVGLLAALFVAVIPSEFLHRSLLGFADHHVFEVLFLSLVVLFLIKAIQSPAVFDKYSILAGVALLGYFITWRSAMYLSGALFILFGVGLLAWNIIRKEHWYAHSMAVVIPIAIALAVWLPLGGWRDLLFLVPGSTAQEVTTTGEIVGTVFAKPGQRTISELMPLLWPQGKFTFAVVISNLHLFAIAGAVGTVLLWRYRQDKAILFAAIWGIVMLIITFNERRFLYYFTLPLAIVSALAVWEIAKWLKGKAFQNAVILALPLVLVSLPLARGVAGPAGSQMTEEWHTALVWLKAQQGEVVSAWGDYGHWIEYETGKRASYLPGPGGDYIARFLLTKDEVEAKAMLDKMGSDFVIVDYLTLTRKYPALTVYAGINPTVKTNTIGFRLYNHNPPLYLRMVYESETLRIYQYGRP